MERKFLINSKQKYNNKELFFINEAILSLDPLIKIKMVQQVYYNNRHKYKSIELITENSIIDIEYFTFIDLMNNCKYKLEYIQTIIDENTIINDYKNLSSNLTIAIIKNGEKPYWCGNEITKDTRFDHDNLLINGCY